MSDINHVTISGALTHEPRVVSGPENDGWRMTVLSIASHERRRAGKDQRFMDYVTFADAKCYEGVGEYCAKILHKGDSVLIEGTLKTSHWKIPTGRRMSKLVIMADSVRFLAHPKPKVEVAATAEVAADQPV